MITRNEWNSFQEAAKDADIVVEDVCIEVEVEGGYEEIMDLPGQRYYDEYGSGIEIDWDFLQGYPAIEEEVIRHYNLMVQFDAADRYQRRAEQGFCDY